MEFHAPSILLGSFVPYAIVFAIRSLKLIPGVIRDVTATLWALVKNQSARVA